MNGNLNGREQVEPLKSAIPLTVEGVPEGFVRRTPEERAAFDVQRNAPGTWASSSIGSLASGELRLDDASHAEIQRLYQRFRDGADGTASGT
jgi:hypothetical protein